ncbi:MAG: universal stress protein, partial [Fidelibacterota bacterium]
VHDEFMSDEEMQMLRVSVKKMKEEFHKTADSAKSEMKNIIHNLHAEDIEVEFLLREGEAPKTICAVSDELNVDLIVMGTNGRDNIHDFILGTTSEYVVRHSKKPVLVVPEQ